MWHPKAIRGRKKPYTAIGIRRIPCLRCGKPSVFQWQICADGNQFRGMCEHCDILMNRLVLRFVGVKNWRAKMRAYVKKVRSE